MSFQYEVTEKNVGAEVQKIVDYGERTEVILSDLDNGNWRITADSRQFWTDAATPGEAQTMRADIKRLREMIRDRDKTIAELTSEVLQLNLTIEMNLSQTVKRTKLVEDNHTMFSALEQIEERCRIYGPSDIWSISNHAVNKVGSAYCDEG